MKKKVNDIEGFINIIEEISWILDGKSVNLKDVVKQHQKHRHPTEIVDPMLAFHHLPSPKTSSILS